jgi:hypothetical protein
MKLSYVTCILSQGDVALSSEWLSTFEVITNTLKMMEHPQGASKFSIYGQSGKKRGMGNGVKPIKEIFMGMLPSEFRREVPLSLNSALKPGDIDVVFTKGKYTFGIEWETGNVSSSHRAVNKMLLGLAEGVLHAGVLIVPVKNFAKYLTDRVGNYEELSPYFSLWQKYNIDNGILYIIGIEHDDVSDDCSYRFPKGSDGRALG